MSSPASPRQHRNNAVGMVAIGAALTLVAVSVQHPSAALGARGAQYGQPGFGSERPWSQPEVAMVAIGNLLDRFHAAAAAADEEAYFSLLADNGVFLGTDATERWTKPAFREYAHPHFAAGKGWTFRPRDRKIDLSAKGDVAWFDELLNSDHLGLCRGSGVLEKHGEAWLIAQYNLSIPIPNDLAKDFVARIREFEKTPPTPAPRP